MEGICMTCLAGNRRLFSLEHASKLALLKFLIQGALKNPLTIGYNLCWECTAQLHSVYKFQIKARKSLQTLESYFNRSLELPTDGVHHCLTTLQSTKVDVMTIDVLTECNIKKEIDEVTPVFEYACLDHTKVEVDIDLPDVDSIKRDDEFCEQDLFAVDDIGDDNTETIVAGTSGRSDLKPLDVTPRRSKSTITADKDYKFNVSLCDSPQSTGKKISLKKIFKVVAKGKSMAPKVTSKDRLDEEVTWQEIPITEEQRDDLDAAASNDVQYTTAPFKCESCILGFWSDKPLATHNNKYHREEIGPYMCDLCKCRFQDITSMNEHRTRHSVLYDCVKCVFNTRRYDDIIRHHTKKHTTLLHYECADCSMRFKTSSKLRVHRRVHHKSEHKCTICDEVFSTYAQMTKHRESHKSVQGSKQCPVCRKMIKQNYLRVHIRMVHGERDPVYCDLCKKYYTNQICYDAHVKSNLLHITPDDYQHKCEKCEKKFLRKYDLVRHDKTVHSDDNDYSCDQCPRKYKFESNLRRHQKVHTKGYQLTRNYVCEECGKAFLSRPTLLAHQVTHTGERPYKCDLCSDTFGFKSALYTHNKLVHEKVKRVRSKNKKKNDKRRVKATDD